MKWAVLCVGLCLGHCPAGTVVAFQLVTEDQIISLDNGTDMRVGVAPAHGGELTSLCVRFDGQWHELLYRAGEYGDAPGWRGKAPLLWPATGVSFLEGTGKNHYMLNAEHYPMPFHGFAMRQPWQVTGQQASDEMAALSLGLSETAQTREYFPFGFELRVEYRLYNDRLSIEYTVGAGEDNDGSMPFSIGNHITFNAPLIAGSEPSSLLFYNEFPDLLLRDDNKAFSGKVAPSPFIGWHSLADLGERQAASLGGLTGAAELLVRDPSGLQLRLVHRGSSEPSSPAIRFNLWADTRDGFFSPEPWLGTQNSLNSGAGLIWLPPGETWIWRIEIIPSRVRQADTADEDST